MMLDLHTLFERLIERYDPDYLVDVLRISTEDLLEAFEERVREAYANGEFSEVESESDDE